MSKKLNIGIYIGPEDSDIAAWLNMLKEHKISRAKWIRGLLAAYSINRSLDIGTVSLAAVEACSKKGSDDRPGHGWQIKGPNGEYVCGSVVNITMGKEGISVILGESWSNNRHLSTFIKALIRKNLRIANSELLPQTENYKKIYSEFLVKENKKALKELFLQKKSSDATKNGSGNITIDHVGENEPAPTIVTEPAPVSAKPSTPAFDFGSTKQQRTKNPLSDYI